MEKAGGLEDTDFFLTSDYGQKQIIRTVKPNVYFAENVFIGPDEKGKVKGWRAYRLSSVMSHIKKATNSKIEAFIKQYGTIREEYHSVTEDKI